MRDRIPIAVLAFLLTFPTAVGHGAPPALPTDFVDQQILGGLSRPIDIAFLPDGRPLFIEQMSATIHQVTGASATTLATIPGVRAGGERGLLGLAVDPQWPVRPFVYVHYTTLGSTIQITRFQVTGDLLNTGSGSLAIDPGFSYHVLVGIPDDADNHNGGTVRFGPDQMLYVSLGDDADHCAAQDRTTLKGVILRLDVRGLPVRGTGPPPKSAITPADNPFAGSSDENERLVWAHGFRNPFRFSIDPWSGELFVGDVGEDSREEVSGLAAGGLNGGWPWQEGTIPFSSCPTGPTGGFANPVFSYAHDPDPSAAVMVGPLYRRAGVQPFPPEYNGDLFVCDYYVGQLYRLEKGVDGTWWHAPMVPGQPHSLGWGTGYDYVSDFEIGPEGAIWYCDQWSGEIRRILHTGTVGVPIAIDRPAPAQPLLYDLQGRRLEHPGPSGVYFERGGKKVVVR